MAEAVHDPDTDATLEEADDRVNKQLSAMIHQRDNGSNTFNHCNVFLAGGNLAYNDIGQRVLPGRFKNQMDSERQQDALIGLTFQDHKRLSCESIIIDFGAPLNKRGRNNVFKGFKYYHDELREVAIKCQPARKDNKCKEIQYLLTLQDHPNIIRILDAGTYTHESTRIYCFVMELCAQTLSEYMGENKYKSFEFDTNFEYAHQMVTGIDFIHSKKILHRDIKPDNILLSTTKSYIRIADFEHAKSIDDNSNSSQVGTSGYRAPEMQKTPPEASFESDSFSLGIVLCMLFSKANHPYGDAKSRDFRINHGFSPNLSRVVRFGNDKDSKRNHFLDLLRETLSLNPKDRPRPWKMLRHHFFDKNSDASRPLSQNEADTAVTADDSDIENANVNCQDALQIVPETEADGAVIDVVDIESSNVNDEDMIQLNSLATLDGNVDDESDIKSESIYNQADERIPEQRAIWIPVILPPIAKIGIPTYRLHPTFNDAVPKYDRRSPETDAKKSETIEKNERIHYLQTELNNPLKTIGFKNAQALLVELEKLKGKSDLDISLKWAECEMRLNQGNEESAIETVWKHFPFSQSASGINRKADKYYRNGHYVGAMLLFKMSFDMGMNENEMPQAKKISAGQRSVVNIKQAVNSLIKEDCKSLEIATDYGLKYMEEIVNTLRSIEHAEIDLSELSCLTDITSVLNKIGNYKKTIQDGEEMAKKIDNKFRKMATNYKHYSWLWNNIGSAYNHLERYRKAEECYMKAIKASEEARDYENENKRQQRIKATKENLERVRKSLASQN